MCLRFLFPRYGHVAGDGDVDVVSSLVEDVSDGAPIVAAGEALVESSLECQEGFFI